MKHVLFLAPNKAGPDNEPVWQGKLYWLGGPSIKEKGKKNNIIRRGDSGEGRERKGDCMRVDAVRLSVVHVTLGCL